MTHKYNLSLLFYPQPDGKYHVACPELENCFTWGSTKEEARSRIFELIAEELPEMANWGGKEDEEMFREGLCMKGKTLEEAEFEINESGEVVFSPETLAHAVGAGG